MNDKLKATFAVGYILVIFGFMAWRGHQDRQTSTENNSPAINSQQQNTTQTPDPQPNLTPPSTIAPAPGVRHSIQGVPVEDDGGGFDD